MPTKKTKADIILSVDAKWPASTRWSYWIKKAVNESCPHPCIISVTLSTDSEIKKINKKWRGKDKPTNVLSFSQDQKRPKNPNMPWILGDVIIAYETVAREAKVEKKEFMDHFIHIVVHGTLHLLGYDHENDGDAEKMEKKELEILKKLKVPNPYV